MALNNDMRSTMETLFAGLDSFLTSKTVVGEAVQVGDHLMIPLSDVSFGVGAGAIAGNTKNNGGGGMGAKIVPNSILMISKDGSVRVTSLKEKQDLVSRIVDMAPDLINRFTNKEKAEDASAGDAAHIDPQVFEEE